MSEKNEGLRAVNPKTGESFVYRRGRWQPERKLGPVEGALMMFQQGLMFEGADEARAAVESAMGKGEYRGLQRAYQDAAREYEGEHPYISAFARAGGATLPLVASLFTGGATTPVAAANMGAQVARGAGTIGNVLREGAAYGQAYGGLSYLGGADVDETNLVDAGKAMATGAGVGAGGAGLATAAVRLQEPAQKLGQYVKQVLGAPVTGVPAGPPPSMGPPVRTPDAPLITQNRIMNAFADAGMTPGAVRAAVAEGHAAGVPTNIADVAGVPAQRLARGTRTVDPKAAHLVDSRLNARAYNQPERVGQAVEDAIGVPPAGPAMAERIALERKTQANPMYEDMRALPPIDDAMVLGDLQQRASAYAPLHAEAARTVARTEGRQVAPLYKDGKLVRLPTFDDIDMIKVAADARSYNNKRGAIDPRNAMDARAQGALKQTIHGEDGLLANVDRVNPIYKEARDVYSGHTAMKNALEEGMEVINKSADEIAEITRGMTAGERELFKQGAVYSVRQQLSRAADAGQYANTLKSIFGWGRGTKREALRAVFGDDAAFARFQASAEAEMNAVNSRNYIQGGSNTADKQVEAAEWMPRHYEDPASYGIRQITDPVIKGAKRATTQPFEVADMLTSMDAQQTDQFLQMLERMHAARLARQSNRGATNAAAIAGSVNAPF